MQALSGRRPASLLPAGLCAALIFAVLPVACTPRADPEGTPRRVAREIERTLTTIAQNEVTRDPELATRLGLPEADAGFSYNRFLTDRSQAAYERARLSRLETRDLLVRITRPARGSALASHLDTLIAAHETAETLFMGGHGTSALGASYPYVADHTRGAYLDVPDLLARFHTLRTPADARAYVDRMAQFADAIQDDRRRLESDARAGTVPPAPILRRMHFLASAAAETPPETSPAVTSFENLLPGIAELTPEERAQLLADVRRIAAENVRPAYAAFAASLNTLANTAPELPGVWQLPDGPAYYAAALKAYTGDDASPAGLHERGKLEVDALLLETSRALAALGLEEGTVGERLAFLAAQPEQVYPDTEEGRAALIGRILTHADRAEAALASQFDIALAEKAGLRAAPPEFAGFLPPAAYLPRALNGHRPARVEINAQRLADWPDFSLAVLAFHELIPGHHLESSAARQADLPLARQMVWNVAYGEGWASYAETLADELGLYSEDPLSRIGYLQSMLLRAAALVADTGIHSERWTRDQAIAYLAETTGLSLEKSADEIDRYTVRPGYAAAYWIGRERILDLRERAIRVLGPKFDPKAFHRVILMGGPRPLSMVEDDVTRWYTAQVQN